MDTDLLKEFLIESTESLDKLDQLFLELENNPSDKDLLNSIFRNIHTIKGTCGFLELVKLESIAHKGENLLDSLRSGRFNLDQAISEALFELVDAIRQILGQLDADNTEGTADYSKLEEKLCALNDPTRSSTAADKNEAEELEKEFQRILAENVAREAGKTPLLVQENVPVEAEQIESKKQSNAADLSLRVDLHLIDSLLNLVSELVLSRNQILQITKNMNEGSLTRATQRLDQITSQIQEGVMKTRMQPIKNVWNKLPRMVRDVAKACGKSVVLETSGEETELDKTVIEAIKDPLTHILRNSIDHGIESPEKRAAAGKSGDGLIKLEACQEGGFVVIQVTDDGAGLNTGRIKAKALEKNLVSQVQISRMSDNEINRLVFAPGFSTAESVTNISGRGVGMDVVRSSIESIGGSIDLSSVSGKGTCLKIKIPLTLAIIPALLVKSAGKRFAIPQNTLQELVRVTIEDFTKSTKEVGKKRFFDFRGKLMPLVFLNKTLSIDPTDAPKEAVVTIAVVQAESGVFGLIIDEVMDNEEIVVKPLSKQLKSIRYFSGATILGDGGIALILDVNGLGQEIESTSQQQGASVEAHSEQSKTEVSEFIVLSAGNNRRVALPLSNVSRLEEFENAVLEMAGEQCVVQYRGTLLPLIDIGSILHSAKDRTGNLSVVVVHSEKKLTGLVVDSFIDIVTEVPGMEIKGGKAGILGSAVLQGKVTDLIDVQALFQGGINASGE